MFVAIEGGEGAGKDLLTERLRRVCNPSTTVFTREPGGTPTGEKLRAVLLDPETDMGAEEELLVFIAARTALVRQVIRPALAEGKTVISNRFALSTLAYQIYGRERNDLLEFLRQLSERATAGLPPVHYVLLDVPPEIGLRRVKQRNDGETRFDAEKQAFHERVRAGYLQHYMDTNYGMAIDARQSPEEVFEQAIQRIRQWQQ